MSGLLLITFTSSFCSMCYSMIMALVMGEFTGEEILTQCMTLGPYLLGLGLGSGWGDTISAEVRVKRLFQIEWLSIIVLPTIPLLQLFGILAYSNLSPLTASIDDSASVRVLLGITAGLSFITGVLGGAQLPLILKEKEKLKSEVILAVNYLGPLFAGVTIVVFSSFAVPFNFQIYFIGMIQLVGIFFLLLRLPKRNLLMVSLMGPLAILYISSHLFPKLETLTVKSAYLSTRVNSWKDFLHPAPFLRVLENYGTLERVRTPYQTIDLFSEPGNFALGIPGNSTVSLNRKPQFDIFSVDVYHQTMVYGSLNLLKKIPQNVLILGAGDGLLLAELKDFTEIKKIVMVELDKKMIEWSADHHLISRLNRGVLKAPPLNAEILVMDAITYLRNSRETFDLILVDFPFPQGQELAKLYSTEFYSLVKRSLSQDGIVMVDLPLYLEEGKELSKESKTIIRTMKEAGFTNQLLLGPGASFVALKPGGEKLAFDYKSFPKSISLPAAFNLVSPFPDNVNTSKADVNRMFWPRGL